MESFVDTIYTAAGYIPIIAIIIGIIIAVINAKSGEHSVWAYLVAAILIIVGVVFLLDALDIIGLNPLAWKGLGTTPEETVTPTL